MALNTNLSISMSVQDEDDVPVFQTDPTDTARTDLATYFSSTIVLTNTNATTNTAVYPFGVYFPNISVIRSIYVETNDIITFQLYDAGDSPTDVMDTEIAGPGGTATAKFYADINGFATNNGGNITVSLPAAGSSSAKVRIFIAGDNYVA